MYCVHHHNFPLEEDFVFGPFETREAAFDYAVRLATDALAMARDTAGEDIGEVTKDEDGYWACVVFDEDECEHEYNVREMIAPI